MNEKVGIVTFYNHQNFGAVLQAYGLSHALKNLEMDPYFICDQRKEEKNEKPDDAKTIDNKRIRRVFGAVANLSAEHKKKFLDFSKKEKRFSYAASFGMDALPEKGKAWYQKQLKGFAEISVREESGQKIVEELLGKSAAVCPDPVFLPETAEWKRIMKPQEEAVAVYMVEFDEGLYQAAKARAEELGVQFVYMGFANVTNLKYQPVLCSPEEWLGFISNAREVFTNSFHGTVFSIFFHKKLYFKPLVRLAKRNGRIFSLLKRLGAEEKDCDEFSGISEIILPKGWEAADQKIAELRKKGNEYLQYLFQ